LFDAEVGGRNRKLVGIANRNAFYYVLDRVTGEFVAGGAIRALETQTGEIRWEFKLHSPPWAGVLSTAGGIVFSGSNEGNFYALDARTGRSLWDFQTGGPIAANPISFTVDGHQRIAISADRVLYAFGL